MVQSRSCCPVSCLMEGEGPGCRQAHTRMCLLSPVPAHQPFGLWWSVDHGVPSGGARGSRPRAAAALVSQPLEFEFPFVSYLGTRNRGHWGLGQLVCCGLRGCRPAGGQPVWGVLLKPPSSWPTAWPSPQHQLPSSSFWSSQEQCQGHSDVRS